jgi:solute:Na+ symporter, SSS family
MANYVIFLYFLAVIAIGFYSRKQIKTPIDFYIAGKKGGLIQVTGSLLATTLGASAILGTLELSQKIGWAAGWFLVCASAGLFILAPISKYVSRYGKFTLPEMLSSFFGKKAGVIASLIIPVAWLGVIAAQNIGAAKILNSIGLLTYPQAVILSGLVVILYTLIGGQKSVLKTDLFQAILILSGVIVLFFVIRTDQPATNEEVTIPKGFFNEKFTIFDLFILFLTYSTTFIVGPDIYSRIFCAKSEKTALYSVLIVAAILIPFAFMLTYLGILSPAPEAGNKSISIITLGMAHLNPLAIGLLIAALLAAVMSSASATLLTASLILTELFGGPLENNKTYRISQISIILTGIVTLVISIYVTSIVQSLLLALSFFSGAFLIPTLAGLLKLKVNKKLVTAAILTGGLVALGGKLVSVYSNEMTGNLLIIFSFVCNGIILFFPFRKELSRVRD